MVMNKRGRIAGVTYDKWLEPGKKRVKRAELKKYSNQLIAFVDILGIKDLIEKHTNNDEHIAIDKIRELRKIAETSTEIANRADEIDYLQISDSFVFVCDPKIVIQLIELLSTIQMRIISECQFLLRGAITIGDAIVEESGKFIVGPAYIKAYQLQDNDAIYPRIIVDKSVTQAIRKSSHPIKRYLLRDSDREFFVDYIKIYMQKGSLGRQQIKSKFRREGIFSYLKDNFKDHYQNERHNISQKYGWTMQYYRKYRCGKMDNKIKFGRSLLETITIALYENPIILFREYVQNSLDAYNTAIDDKKKGIKDFHVRIDIDTSCKKIVITDNGYAIDSPQEFSSKMLSIGGSDKTRDRTRYIGFRGIGRISGWPFCKKLTFRSKAMNSDKINVCVWESEKYRSLLDNEKIQDDLETVIKKIVKIDVENAGRNFSASLTSSRLHDYF